MRDIGQAPRHRGRPPQCNPEGQTVLPRGFVEGLDRIADTAFGRSPAHAAKSPRRRWVHLTARCSRFAAPVPVAELKCLSYVQGLDRARLQMAKSTHANTTGALDKVLGERVDPPFSATRLIGGTLRNLYNDAEQEDVLGLTRLLRVLEDDRPAE
jgi:hypothetical protein